MISSIFYFANTEQEYLDNFNNHQVKPYTIVFCKDTHTLWKDGIKYGGDTAQTEALISDWVETNITPLIEQLQDAMDAANDAAGEEKERLDGMIGGINDLIKDEVENMLGDSEWIQENWPQGVTQWQSGWNEDLESYLTTVGYWDVDPVTGEKTTKWSKLEQSVDSINSSVGRINTNIGTTELLLSSLQQLITTEGTARTALSNTWTQRQNDTEKILKWMYSGLTTESGRDKTFADLTAAAQDGETTGISTIGAIVEKVPVIDPQTGNPQLDQDGNIVYQKDSNNNYIYRAKSTLSSALNDSLATMINESTENTATSLVITSVGDCIAALRNEVIDGRGAYASLGAKFAGMEAGLVAKADLNEAVAGLVIDGVRTVKLTVLNSLPSGASYFNTTQQLPSELDQHTKLRYTVSEFTALINTIFVHKLVAPDTWDDVPASYGADLTYDVHPGSYLKCSDDKYLYIEEISFKSSVFSEVDSKIDEAKSGLVASNNFTAASIVAMVNDAGSSVNIDANKINLNGQATFITAVGLALNVQLLVADEVAATTISANTIDASSSYTVTDENDQSTTYTSHTIVNGDGVSIYNGDSGWDYDPTNLEGNNPNIRLSKDGEGWLANGHIIWNCEGDTYIGPGDPEYGSDGIYVYDDDGTTKIKLQGEIIANDLSLQNIQNGESRGNGFFVGNKKKYESGERDVAGSLHDGGFSVGLQTFYHQPANSSGLYGDVIIGHGGDETTGGYTTVDWGAIGIGKNHVSAVANPRNVGAQPIKFMNSDVTPPVTLQVKGKDGYVYTGFTGTHNGMYYINGIAIGPGDSVGSNNTMI